MTAPFRPQADPNERIRQNVAKMRAQGAPDADVEHYLQNVEGLTPKAPDPAVAAPQAAMPAVDPRTALDRRALATGFAPQSTAAAPDQASRREEQARRPLLESVDLPFGLQRDLNQGVQSATFGTSDELAAALRSMGDETYADAVAKERQGLQSFRSEHPARAFVDAIAGGVAGGGAMAAGARAAGAGARVVAPTVLGRLRGAATVGAASGAATGAGSAEGGIAERAKGAAAGGALGAGLGLTLGAAGEGIRRIARRGVGESVKDAADRKLLEALKRDELTPDQALTRAGEFSDDKPAVILDVAGQNTRRLARAVRTQPGKGAAQLDDMLHGRAAGTEERTINDVIATTGLGGRANAFKKAEDLIAEQRANARPLYEKAYAAAPIAHEEIDAAMKIPAFREAYERGRRIADLDGVKLPGTVSAEARAPVTVRDAGGRLRQDLSNVADKHLEEEWSRLAELNAREESLHGAVKDAHYRADYEELPRTEKFGHKGKEDLPDADGTIDPEVLAGDNKIISDYNRSAIVRTARAKAMKRIEAELSGRPSAEDFDFGANAEPAKAAARPIPTQGIDYMKRGLDDLIESKMRGGSMGRTEARALRNKLKTVLSVADEANPDYAAARARFAGDAKHQEAFDLGRQLFKQHPDETSLALADMGPGERDLFRRGALESLGDRIENRTPGRDPAALANKTLDKKRVRLLFDDDTQFAGFQKRLGEEAQMHQTKLALQGGSQTADKLAELADMADVPIDAIVAAATGSPGRAVSRIAQSALADRLKARLQGITQAKADALATRMTAGAGGRDELTAMLREVRDRVSDADGVRATRGATVTRRTGKVTQSSARAAAIAGESSPVPVPAGRTDRDEQERRRRLAAFLAGTP